MNTETVEYTPEQFTGTNGAMVHLACCTACDFATRFKPLPSGTGFSLVDSDLALGIGDNGRPVCPNGHGEMELADDRLPIEQAMEQVAERLTEPQRLPFPAPAFNYEGALHEIFEMEKDNAILEAKFNDADERRKKAKAAWDDGRGKLSILIATLKEREQDRLHEIARREAAAAAGHPEETNLVRCAWEEANDGETCPICSDPELTAAMARDSAAHLDEVQALLELRVITAAEDLLQYAGVIVAPSTIRTWSVDDRAAVCEWANAVIGNADPMPPRPAILGTAHVADGFTTSEAVPGDTYQSCTECGARLLTNKTGDDEGASFEPYPAGTLVGVDCAGAKEPARYAKRGKRKAK